MTADEIVQIAQRLQCGPKEAAVSFARMVAEHCAQLAKDCSSEAAASIRNAFHLDHPA